MPPRISFAEFCTLFLDYIGKLRLHRTTPLTLLPIDYYGHPRRSKYMYPQLERIFDMATPKKKRSASFSNQIEFINYKFNQETKAAFEAWYSAKGNTFLQAVYDTLGNSYKLSLSWDSSNDCFIAAMTGREDSLNPHRCITLRSTDWVKALAALAYVHTVVFDSEIWEVQGDTDMV